MRYGRRAPGRGWLPVFSVGSEEEAARLLALACSRNYSGDYVAFELARSQTLDNLESFGRRLAEWHDRYLVPEGKCECT
ncbi:MAG TPA: hypothetical protein VN829_23115 [Dongiaceae bacterium]|nr:hypothetical protein [Dongiaceae bacterium]